MKLTNAILYAVLAAEAPNPKTDALAAQGPAAVVAALKDTPNAELAEAEKFGDTEHINSINEHLGDYESERKERINDAKGGVIQTRQRRAIQQGTGAVVAALEQELAEAKKYNDVQHIASIEKHLADYASERRERIADAQGGHTDTRQAAAAW